MIGKNQYFITCTVRTNSSIWFKLPSKIKRFTTNDIRFNACVKQTEEVYVLRLFEYVTHAVPGRKTCQDMVYNKHLFSPINNWEKTSDLNKIFFSGTKSTKLELNYTTISAENKHHANKNKTCR